MEALRAERRRLAARVRADLRGPGLRVLATEEALLTLANGDLADLRFDDVEPDSTARKSGTPRRLRRLIGHPCYTPLASARARHAARPPMADQSLRTTVLTGCFCRVCTKWVNSLA